MGTEGPTSRHTLEDTLEVFERVEVPGTPMTTTEVAEELDCARRTAYGKLEELAESGKLQTKKVGARGRVWWRPPEQSATDGTDPAPSDESTSIFESAQFQELVGAVRDYAIFVLDEEGTVRTWNEGARQMKGYDEADIVGEHFSRFYTEEDRENGRPERNLETATEQGRIEDEGWRVRQDGTTFWANVTITSIRDDDGDVEGFVKVTRDMTDRHEYEERLRKERDRFETLVREVKDYAIFLLDSDGNVQTWNQGASELKGYDEDDIIGEHVSTFYTEDDREAGRPEENLQKAKDAGRVEDEGLRVREDGSTFWANVIITALYDDGELRGFAKVTRDMTDRHEYEQRLREQRDELDELNQINEVIRDIDQVLVTATTREEIEQAVCDRLAASDTYSAAWTAEYDEDYEKITPRTWAGIDDDYLEAIRRSDGDEASATEKGVGAEALRTQTIRPIQRLGQDSAGEPWRESSVDHGFHSAITVPLLFNDVEYGVLTVYANHESAFDERKVAVMSELGETISHAIAAIRRKEREQTLTALQTSTRDLLHTENEGEIGDVIVETLTGDLALDDAVVYHFDTAENALEPVSSSFQGDSPARQLAPLSAGADSPIWTSFIEDEEQFGDSVMPVRGIGSRRTMIVPLGDYGVLAVAAREGESFDASTRNLVELVAATAEAAFDRLESQANLRERDELLQEQNQRLQRLNGINTIIREVDQGLVQATTREEVQRVVCDRLTESDRFRFAWIGAQDEFGEGLVPLAHSGEDRGYLDGIDLSDTGTAEPEPAIAATRSGEVTVVSNVAENLRSGQWRREAFSREFQSIISVPLRYGDVTYGVMTVYADQPEVFDEMERSVFGELGETIANTLNAVDTKQALLGDQVVELEFTLGDEPTSFLARLAKGLGREITFEGVIPLAENRARVFFVAHDAPAGEMRDLLDRSVAVESSQVIATRDEGHLVEAVVSGKTIPLTLLEYGASLRSLAAREDGIQLIVDLPAGEDVRGFIDRFQARYETAEFVARRERERSIRTRDGFYADLEAHLTDRQLEVLKTAYYSGFFDTPRRSTGSDVADLLDVSQPTVTEQLRAAQCKVLDLLFADGPSAD